MSSVRRYIDAAEGLRLLEEGEAEGRRIVAEHAALMAARLRALPADASQEEKLRVWREVRDLGCAALEAARLKYAAAFEAASSALH